MKWKAIKPETHENKQSWATKPFNNPRTLFTYSYHNFFQLQRDTFTLHNSQVLLTYKRGIVELNPMSRNT